MTWQLLTAISVAGLSISIILQRILIHKDKADPVAYAVLFQALVAVVVAVLVAVNGLNLNNLDHFWLPALTAVVLYGAGHIVYAKTLQKVEASIFSVLFATHAVWVMVLGIILFHEHLNLIQIIGSLLIFASIFLVVNNYRHLSLNKGTFLGVLTGLLFGIAITSWSYVGRNTDTLSWAAVSFAGAATVSLLFSPKSIKKMKPMLDKKILPTMLLLSVFYAIGSVAMLEAYKVGSFSLVSPLRQTGIILTTLLAFLILSQERTRIVRKLLAAAICSAGVILIVI